MIRRLLHHDLPSRPLSHGVATALVVTGSLVGIVEGLRLGLGG